MKKKLSTNIEKFRITTGRLASDSSWGMNGAFQLYYLENELGVICSNEEGWDHVSVSLQHRCPTWEEMCFVKRLFFEKDETVIQYHPREDVYINNNPHVLHMWKPQGIELPEPPVIMV